MRAALALAALLLAAHAAAEPFADSVVSLTLGTGGGGGDASRVLGPPRGGGAFQGSLDTLSLGLGGSIVLAFTDNVIVDRPGPDFTVFENAFLTSGTVTGPLFPEPGTVSVSADGVHFVTFPCALDQPPYYPGCAGVYPVFANADVAGAPSPLVPSTVPVADLVGVPVGDFAPPAGSGGDSFDLADVGLMAARFVRIDGGPLKAALAGLSGFDLDAVAAVHSIDTAGLADTDDDGFPDVADSCPTVANPDQADADHDGVGDACEDTPPPDADGDGVADGVDDCPHVFDPAQADTDGDGVGDACDDCPAVANPAQQGCPPPPPPDADGDGVADAVDDCPSIADPAQADRDGDGTGDACDPCPDDATCAPLLPARFPGDGKPGPGDALLTYVVPVAATTTLPAGAHTATIVVLVASDVVPRSVRVRVGRRNLVAPDEVVPGSSKTITVPLARRRTVVRLRAVGPFAGRRRQVDVDRLTLLVP